MIVVRSSFRSSASELISRIGVMRSISKNLFLLRGDSFFAIDREAAQSGKKEAKTSTQKQPIPPFSSIKN